MVMHSNFIGKFGCKINGKSDNKIQIDTGQGSTSRSSGGRKSEGGRANGGEINGRITRKITSERKGESVIDGYGKFNGHDKK